MHRAASNLSLRFIYRASYIQGKQEACEQVAIRSSVSMCSSYTGLPPTQRSLSCHSAPLKSVGLAACPLRHCAGRTAACRSFVGDKLSETALPMLLAGSVIVNTLDVPLLLLPQPAAASAVLQAADTPGAAQRAPVAQAPPVHEADDQQQQQQQWWQQDQQVWQELTSPSELTAYLNSSQPPPAWPALDSTALAPKLRLVEFYASWCPACRAAAPEMAEVAADPYLRQHCSFARINIDRAKPLVRQLGISKIPTVLLVAPDGSTLDSFRASGQAARDAITQQLAVLQQLQQQPQPSLPVLPPAAAASGVEEQPQEQPAPSEVEGDSSSTAAAACGTAPEPTCGQLPPGVALPESSAGMPDSNSSSTGSLSAAPGSNGDGQLGSSSSAVPVDPALAAAKAQFLQQYGSGYGYSGSWLDQHYQAEVGSRLGPNKHYLDYTGAALYPASLLEAVYKDLLTHSYGNPHSVGAPAAADSGGSNGGSSGTAPAAVAAPPAAASEAVMEAAAAAVLQHLHADPAEYQVVFTRSATEALKLVGEMFPFRSGSSSTGSSMMQHEPGPRSELDMLPGTLRPQQQQQLAAGLADGLLDTDGTNSNRSSSSSTGKSSNAGSKFVYTRSNHNSVLGIGAYAAAAGAQLVPQTDDGMEAWVASLEQQQQQQEESTAGSAPTYNLLAYPAEDNYAGVLYPLQWINRVRAASQSGAQRTLVLLDAAAYLPTHDLDLTTHPADFVVASFYKMFGYPTGLGALVLRTEHVPQLNKVYFGGGSVALATPEGCWHVGKCDPAAALSDGTPNYLGAAALKLAYDSWDSRGGMQAVEQHTHALSSWLFSQLSSLRHSNGVPLIQLYGRHGLQSSPEQQGSAEAASGFSQGAVFNFQVLQPDGQPVSFSKVDRDATAAGLYLRSGCVCNPGACYDSLGLEAAEVQQLAGLKEGCGDEMDFITVPRPPRKPAAAPVAAAGSSSTAGAWWCWRGASSIGASRSGPGQPQQQEGGPGGSSPQEGDLVPTQVPLGSVRVSLGWASTFEDVYAFVQFLHGYLS